tara:strand:- start:494 stop:775 length:282 start_codon:yes stop_codon:yes gene_type:complete
MSFQNPSDGYFVYSKSDCKWCRNIASLIPNAKFVNSDEYLNKNKKDFFMFVDNLSGSTPRTFPMVFLNKRFIGGYSATSKYIEELESFKLVDF